VARVAEVMADIRGESREAFVEAVRENYEALIRP
jgi:Tat protein secretion system quality control protein TatD with DNase activity